MRDLLGTELLVGASGSGADTAIYPEFLSQLLGMKFKTIKGYQGTKGISLAKERGEVEGLCLAYDSLLQSRSRARAASRSCFRRRSVEAGVSPSYILPIHGLQRLEKPVLSDRRA